MKTLLVLVGILLWTAAALAQGAAQFGSRSDLVVVPVVVVDDRGHLVNNLDTKDFEVFEDGQAVSVSAFSKAGRSGKADEDGRYVVLLLDDLRTPPVLASRIKALARGFADRMEPRDIVTVLRLNGDRSVTGRDPAVVRKAIDAYRPFGATLRAREWDADYLLETIRDLAAQLVPVTHPRKVLVYIGNATQFARDPGENRPFAAEPLWRAATAALVRARLTLYALDPAGLGPSTAKYDAADTFADESGGASFVNTNEFDAAVDRVWRESGEYYLLGYAPPTTDPSRHDIDVRVSLPGARIRARKAR